MGIRCECPNGHRLNVKDELAGKRGVCPKCGAGFQIPEAGTAPAGAAGDSLIVPVLPARQPAAEPLEPRPEAAAVKTGTGRPSPARAIPKPAAEPTAPTPPAEPVATPPATPPPATPPPAGPPPEAPPSIEWYARPTSGEQLGPATEQEVSAWIAAGRVTSDSYVWRTGWEDWRRVADASSDLPAALPPRKSEAPTRPPAAARYASRRRNAGRRRVVAVGLLLLLAIALGGVLYWVLAYRMAKSRTALAVSAPVRAEAPERGSARRIGGSSLALLSRTAARLPVDAAADCYDAA